MDSKESTCPIKGQEVAACVEKGPPGDRVF